MTKQEAIKMIEARIECLNRMTSGSYRECDTICNSCLLNYTQGDLGGQKEWMKMAIESLKGE